MSLLLKRPPRHADAEAPNKPQNAGDEEDNAPVEVLKPNRESAPEDVGEPLVLINDTLDDGNIKGLEESERIQRAEAAKREAAERRAEERRQRQAEQRAAAARKTQAQQELLRKKAHWQLKNAHFKRVLKKQSVKPLPNAINWHNWKRQRKPLPSVNLPKTAKTA